MPDGGEEFVRLVASMRAKQKEYFRQRQPSLLNECRDLERRVDKAVAAILRPDTPGLFGDGGSEGPG